MEEVALTNDHPKMQRALVADTPNGTLEVGCTFIFIFQSHPLLIIQRETVDFFIFNNTEKAHCYTK